MRNPLRKFICLPAALLALISLTALAREANKFDRITPVPATEPIPTLDFFRPYVFIAPTLNAAGTHFLAFVSSGSDRTDAIVYDLATKSIERLTGGTDNDIVEYRWLNDRRFIFKMSYKKMYAEGLFSAEIGDLTHSVQIEKTHPVTVIGVPRDTPLRPIVWIQDGAVNERRLGGIVQLNAERTLAHEIYAFPVLQEQFPEEFFADADGHLAFAVTMNNGHSALHRLAGNQWIKCPVDLDAIEIIGPGEKSDELFVLGPRQTDKPRALQRLDAVTGRLRNASVSGDG